MRIALAVASLRRHQSRTLLAIIGVAIAAAMLLDMVMLSTGLRESFRQLLVSRNFQMRLAPRGTLPFDTEATIGGAGEINKLLRTNPDIEEVSPVLGASVHATLRDRAVTAFALGVLPAVQGDYRIIDGVDLRDAGEVVANADFLGAIGAGLGDTISIATGYDPQLRMSQRARRVIVTGRARFLYLSTGQPAVALPLAALQGMNGASRRDPVSLFMVRLRTGASADTVGRWITRSIRTVNAISTEKALATVDERLSYFRQIAYILGAVSLALGFLLVTTLVTVSVNERIGEIAVMRAIGVSRGHVVQQILLEGIVITLTGALLGLALGLVTARYLNGILSAFPGLPNAIDFFLFQPRAAWTALGLLAACGVAAGIYPAWRAASRPIAVTLREEAVA
ncbi:MAG: FtsX-like permease family protein [Gemmatimonadaceae bacterium]|nr:FtsX-like permease family protein [Gemmatimonadaceae bacterium]MDQ3517330.1 FtsX-like permease family protein [Gemmatimonadota bacterium]